MTDNIHEAGTAGKRKGKTMTQTSIKELQELADRITDRYGVSRTIVIRDNRKTDAYGSYFNADLARPPKYEIRISAKLCETESHCIKSVLLHEVAHHLTAHLDGKASFEYRKRPFGNSRINVHTADFWAMYDEIGGSICDRCQHQDKDTTEFWTGNGQLNKWLPHK